MMPTAAIRTWRKLRRALPALIVAAPALMFGSTAFADSLSISIGYGHDHKRHWHRHHHRPVHPVFPRYHHRHMYRPAVIYRTVVVDPPPVVVPYAQSCTHGLWRHVDGAMVEGVACRQPDGSWRME